MAPVLKNLGVPRLPPRGSLGTDKGRTVTKIWRAVPIFLARVNGVLVSQMRYYLAPSPLSLPLPLPLLPRSGTNKPELATPIQDLSHGVLTDRFIFRPLSP